MGLVCRNSANLPFTGLFQNQKLLRSVSQTTSFYVPPLTRDDLRAGKRDKRFFLLQP